MVPYVCIATGKVAYYLKKAAFSKACGVLALLAWIPTLTY
jgi:hypothetical protein